MESFELYIFSFGLLSFDTCSLLSRLTVACELMLGLGLASGIWRRAMNFLCALMLAIFSAFLIWRMALGDRDSCHCFGDVLEMSPAQSLLKNAVLGILLAVGSKAPRKDIVDYCRSFVGRLSHVPARVLRSCLAALVSIAVLGTVFAACPTSSYFRSHRSTVDLDEQRWRPISDGYGLSEGRQVVIFLSPLCEHCRNLAAKLYTIMQRHELDMSRMHIVFMTVTDDMSDMEILIPSFYEQAGIPEFPLDTRILGYETFIPLTDGIMPLVCLFEDASLLQEYTYSTLDENVLAEFLR